MFSVGDEGVTDISASMANINIGGNGDISSSFPAKEEEKVTKGEEKEVNSENVTSRSRGRGSRKKTTTK